MDAYRFRTALLVILIGCGLTNFTHQASAAYIAHANSSTVSQPIDNRIAPYKIVPCDWANTYIVLAEVNPGEWAVYDEPIGCPARFLGYCFGTNQLCSTGRHFWLGYAVPNGKPKLLVPYGQLVVEFADGPKNLKPIGQLNAEGWNPTAVTVYAKTNTTYVSVSNPAPTGGAAIFVYGAGSSTPTAVLNVQGAFAGAGVSVDAKGNVFWAFDDDNGQGNIAEFVAGKNQPLILSLPGYFGAAGDIQIDNKENIIVASPNQSAILVYTLKGHEVNAFAVSGTPASIALD